MIGADGGRKRGKKAPSENTGKCITAIVFFFFFFFLGGKEKGGGGDK